MSIVTSIIVTRTWAIYDRSQKVLWMMLLWYIVCFGPSFYAVFDFFARQLPPDDVSPQAVL